VWGIWWFQNQWSYRGKKKHRASSSLIISLVSLYSLMLFMIAIAVHTRKTSLSSASLQREQREILFIFWRKALACQCQVGLSKREILEQNEFFHQQLLLCQALWAERKQPRSESICQTRLLRYAVRQKMHLLRFYSSCIAETGWLSRNCWSRMWCVWCVGRNQQQQHTVRAAAFNLGAWH